MANCRALNSGVELSGGVTQVATADDVVAIEYRARLVSGALHRNAFGDAGPG
jgi:hypothetical protein